MMFKPFLIVVCILFIRTGDCLRQCYSCDNCSILPTYPEIITLCEHSCRETVYCDGSGYAYVNRYCGWESRDEGCVNTSENSYECSCNTNLCNIKSHEDLCNGSEVMVASFAMILCLQVYRLII